MQWLRKSPEMMARSPDLHRSSFLV